MRKTPPKYEEKSKRPALAGHGPVLQGDQGDQQGETHADVHVPAIKVGEQHVHCKLSMYLRVNEILVQPRHFFGQRVFIEVEL